MEKITIKTKENKQVLDITERVEELLGDDFSGLVHLFVKHTTAALSCADLDPGTDEDMLRAYYGMIPDLDFNHPHDPKHTPDHILATLIGPSITLPASSGKLSLGTWQRVVLFEFNGPRDRTVGITKVKTG